MRALFFLAVLLLIAIAGVGFSRGWFTLSTNNTEDKPSATITVDQGRIHEDKEKVRELGHEAKEKIVQEIEKVKQ